MTIIKDLEIKNKEYNYTNNTYCDKLSDLSRINIFIGENNSGKSRFLRSLFYYKDENYKLKFTSNSEYYTEYIKNRTEFEKDYNNNLNNRDLHSLHAFEFAIDSIYSSIFDDEDYLEESTCPCEKLIKLYENNYKKSSDVNILTKQIIEDYFIDEEKEFNLDYLKYNFYKLYIPILRGLIPLKTINNEKEDVYGIRIKEDYFGENSKIKLNDYEYALEEFFKINNEIITGCFFYESLVEYIRGDEEKRAIKKEYEHYLSENFFEGKTVELTPKLNDDVISVKIGNEKEQKIYDLGDGIQSIILITFPLFLYLNQANEKNNILVFIEEPEINLHPKLQRKLIETFLDDKFKHYQFFFTTHSNHFIDRVLENDNISIYSFEKNFNEDERTNFDIEKVSFDNYPTLEKLGVLPSSVLMSNCTILVEGSTDKTHYELYLKLYQDYMYEKDKNFKKFEEGIHYSFLVGGGSEAKNSVKKFSKIEMEKIFFITDQDNKETVNKLKKEYEELNYKNYHILPVKEVENLMNKEIIIKILKNWNNVNNYIQNEDFNEEEYKHANFYKYLKDNLFKDTPKNFPNEYSFKKRFANYEYKNISQYEELTNEIKEVTEKLYDFIIKNNEI